MSSGCQSQPTLTKGESPSQAALLGITASHSESVMESGLSTDSSPKLRAARASYWLRGDPGLLPRQEAWAIACIQACLSAKRTID